LLQLGAFRLGTGFSVAEPICATTRRMRMRRILRGTGAGLALSLLIGGIVAPSLSAAAGTASSPPHYPVVWSFLPTAVLSALENGPDAAPPGSNVPCAASAAHP